MTLKGNLCGNITTSTIWWAHNTADVSIRQLVCSNFNKTHGSINANNLFTQNFPKHEHHGLMKLIYVQICSQILPSSHFSIVSFSQPENLWERLGPMTTHVQKGLMSWQKPTPGQGACLLLSSPCEHFSKEPDTQLVDSFSSLVCAAQNQRHNTAWSFWKRRWWHNSNQFLW